MERLTRRMCGGFGLVPGYELNTVKGMKAVVDRLAAYEDTGMTPKQVRLISNVLQEVGETYNCWFDYVVNCVLENSHLKELAQAEKDGRLVEYMPGDKVYDRFGTPWIVESSEIHLIGAEIKHLYRCGNPGTEDYCALYEEEIRTREEAEAALKKREEVDDEID